MEKNNFFLLMAWLFLLSCGSSGSSKISEENHITMENAKPLTAIIDTVKYVSLKNEKNIFSGRIDKLMSKGDTMYIFDSRISKSLSAYRKDGTFLFNVGKLGGAPGEYIELGNFTIDNQYFYCIDNAMRKILVYDINNGAFVRKLDMPIYVDDIALFDDGNFIFYSDNRSGQAAIHIANRDLKIIDELLHYSEDDYSSIATLSAFTESKDKIVFSCYANDTIVVFDKKSHLDPIRYVVDFGSHSLSKIDKSNRTSMNEAKYILPPVYITDNMMIGDVNLPYPVGNDYWMYGAFAYNMSTNQMYQNGKIDEILSSKIPMEDKLILPIEGVANNEIISMIDDYERYQELVKLGFPAAPKHIEQQLKEAEPLLVFYRLTAVRK